MVTISIRSMYCLRTNRTNNKHSFRFFGIQFHSEVAPNIHIQTEKRRKIEINVKRFRNEKIYKIRYDILRCHRVAEITISECTHTEREREKKAIHICNGNFWFYFFLILNKSNFYNTHYTLHISHITLLKFCIFYKNSPIIQQIDKQCENPFGF